MAFASLPCLIRVAMASLALLWMLSGPVVAQMAPSPDVAPVDAAPAESGEIEAAPTPTAATPAPTDPTPTPAAATPAPTDPTPTPAAATPAPTDPTPTPAAEPTDSGAGQLEPASFKGVVPGKSTIKEVAAAWGAPREIQKRDQVLMHLFTVEPFKRVEVSYFDDKVISVVIRFDHTFPASAVAQQLELTSLRPVVISDDMGNVQGQVYPERGVLFAFTTDKEADESSTEVSHIILEPITAEPFLLRAEVNFDSQLEASLDDVEQALALEGGNARAHWLHGRLLVADGKMAKAAEASAEAVRLEPGNPEYRVTRAKILSRTGKLGDAIAEAKKAVEAGESRPHIKARALCLLGDLSASGSKPNYTQAIQYHTQAVEAADSLALNPHPAIRVAAKEVLIDAHLGAAHDIAWGTWKEKEKAVARWLDLAEALAKDYAETEGGNGRQVFRVAARALAVSVGLRGKLDPEKWSATLVRQGEELIAASDDPVQKDQLKWDLGVALYDALQIYELRRDHEAAMKYGERAIEYLEGSSRRSQVATADYLLGRLYFRMGSIEAMRNKNHRVAISWYDKGLPLLRKPVPGQFFGELGRHGQTFVSMSVSYWETGQRQQAIDLTQFGIALMEEAVNQGSLNDAALSVPYGNLATMHREMGAEGEAEHYQALAEKHLSTTMR